MFEVGMFILACLGVFALFILIGLMIFLAWDEYKTRR